MPDLTTLLSYQHVRYFASDSQSTRDFQTACTSLTDQIFAGMLPNDESSISDCCDNHFVLGRTSSGSERPEKCVQMLWLPDAPILATETMPSVWSPIFDIALLSVEQLRGAGTMQHALAFYTK